MTPNMNKVINNPSDVSASEKLVVTWFEESDNLGMYGFRIKNTLGKILYTSSTEFGYKRDAISSGNFWIERNKR